MKPTPSQQESVRPRERGERGLRRALQVRLSSPATETVLLVVLTAAAAAVRFRGIGWGLPHLYNSDEQLLFAAAWRLDTIRPLSEMLSDFSLSFFIYPPFLMHCLLAAKWLAGLGHFLPTDVDAVERFCLLGRAISASFGVGTVVLLQRVGRRLDGPWTGLLAAGFLAFAPLHVRDSHFFTTDVPFTFFLVLLLLLSMRIAAGASVRFYLGTGIVAGIACATKQTALIALPVVLLAHLLSPGGTAPAAPRTPGSRLRRFLDWRPLAAFVLGVMVAAAVMDPYPFLVPRLFVEQARITAAFVAGASQPHWVFQFTDSSPLYWITNLLWFGLGPPLELVGIAGIGWAIWRRRTADRLILAFLAIYAVVVGLGPMKFVRYAIPLLPFLCVLGARCLVEIRRLARSAAVRRAIVAVEVTTLAASAFFSVAYLHVFETADARSVAARWIARNVPAGATVLADNSYTTPLLGSYFRTPDLLRRNNTLCRDNDCVLEDDFRIKVINLASRGGFPHVPPSAFDRYLAERLQGVQYLVMGDEYPEQYAHRPAEYPTVVAFYRQLADGTAGFREVASFKTYPEWLGIRIDDDRSELTFRLFDHPRVRIFERQQGATGAPTPTGDGPANTRRIAPARRSRASPTTPQGLG